MRAISTILVAGVFLWASSVFGSALPHDGDSPGEPTELEALSFESASSETYVLRRPDALRHLVVTGKFSSGPLRDLTRTVSFTVHPEGVIQVDSTGMVTPLADGEATLTATGPNGLEVATTMRVEGVDHPGPVSYPNQIVPTFTKLGCNSGGCHGKSGGQNGFRLSLFGFDSRDSYEWLVQEARGRRLFPGSADNSLILLKPTNTVPHVGGRRLEPGSREYVLLRRWIMQGLPYADPEEPVVTRIQVLPDHRTVASDANQQICVLAHYSDGTIEDVTHSAQYETNDAEMAEVSETGLVEVTGQPGDVAIMVRYGMGHASAYRATVPLGSTVDDLPEIRNLIDEHVFSKLKLLGMAPSEMCDDPTFVRRITLDLAGRLPTVEEVTTFIDSNDPEKRDQLTDKLLASTDYAEFFSGKWVEILRNKRQKETYKRGTYGFYEWIRQSFHENMPYDEFARSIVTASGPMSENAAVSWYREVKESKQQMEDVAQLFLGQRLQCAQCHHHPFEKWSQDDYYGMTAFFSQIDRKEGPDVDEIRIYHKRGQAGAENPKTKRTIPPTTLGSTALELDPTEDPRHALVDWMVQRDNPFFGRTLVNRYWKHFFTRGLVHPEDDMRATNPASNPELLDALAQTFIDSGYNLKALIRLICQSATYQLDSHPNEVNEDDKQNFSRYYPRRLSAEVLLDAIDTVTGSTTTFTDLPTGTRAVQIPDRYGSMFFRSSGIKSYFLSVFGRSEGSSASECERQSAASLAQSLHLLNGPEVQKKIAGGRAKGLAADRQRTVEQKVRELYLLTYARPPKEWEIKLSMDRIAKRRNSNPQQDYADILLDLIRSEQAYEDIIWVLINTKEFMFNH